MIGRNIFQLSGGEKQKIACAGVSIMKPDIFVLDEPSSNLDAASIMDLRRIIAHWKEQGKRLLYRSIACIICVGWRIGLFT